MIAKVQIYDNNKLKDELSIMPSDVIDNGISTDYYFPEFVYHQLNYGYRSNRTDAANIKGANVDGGWGV